jgi:hypothetical protein
MLLPARAKYVRFRFARVRSTALLRVSVQRLFCVCLFNGPPAEVVDIRVFVVVVCALASDSNEDARPSLPEPSVKSEAHERGTTRRKKRQRSADGYGSGREGVLTFKNACLQNSEDASSDEALVPNVRVVESKGHKTSFPAAAAAAAPRNGKTPDEAACSTPDDTAAACSTTSDERHDDDDDDDDALDGVSVNRRMMTEAQFSQHWTLVRHDAPPPPPKYRLGHFCALCARGSRVGLLTLIYPRISLIYPTIYPSYPIIPHYTPLYSIIPPLHPYTLIPVYPYTYPYTLTLNPYTLTLAPLPLYPYPNTFYFIPYTLIPFVPLPLPLTLHP